MTDDEQFEDLDDEAWDTLLESIEAKKCTPFLGAGIGYPVLPTGTELAAQLAKEHEYPFSDTGNLPRVAQYIATNRQPGYVKRRVTQALRDAQDSYYREHGKAPNNYKILADFGLPMFITTNYDSFLARALTAANNDKRPTEQAARWNDLILKELGPYPDETPTPDDPAIFYMHGMLADESTILLTEDDYIDFTVSLALEPMETTLLWHQARRALSTTSLLFIGYSLEDWNFRVLMRFMLSQQRISRTQQPFSLSIQLADKGLDHAKRERAKKFLDKYMGNSAIQVHWSDASKFLERLDSMRKGN